MCQDGYVGAARWDRGYTEMGAWAQQGRSVGTPRWDHAFTHIGVSAPERESKAMPDIAAGILAAGDKELFAWRLFSPP